MKRFIISLGSC